MKRAAERQHPDRVAAALAYRAAVAARRAAEDVAGTDPEAFDAACAAESAACAALVAAELAHPTAREWRRQSEQLRQRNRGLDF